MNVEGITDDPYTFVSSRSFKEPCVDLKEVTLEKLLGKGKNNRVFRIKHDGRTLALRVPRKKSDTESAGAAAWEGIQMLKASQLNVAPPMYGVWYSKHSTGKFPSGLYSVSEVFDMDLDKYTIKVLPSFPKSKWEDGSVEKIVDGIASKIVSSLSVLSSNRLFLYDLKPQNLVLSRTDDDSFDVRVIDYGRDFCELREDRRDDQSTPVVDHVERMVARQTEERTKERVTHVLFTCMLLQLSAVTTRFIYHEKGRTRMSRKQRSQANGLARLATSHLDTMRPCDVKIVKEVLRTDNVKGVLKHYNGRRNAGTRRTLRLAQGIEN